ncbi:hypothetical protein I5S53_18995 [Pseudomonas juntendi]|uniref:hypothetical protein n=1 Tax=Pseudomonas TaxID=286 RepID=UPI0012DE63E4|nr:MULTISPECIES: hypothetical protein [Pseudomonas]MBH3386033.1 hypothetical protein [Pseudomonas juntendi]
MKKRSGAPIDIEGNKQGGQRQFHWSDWPETDSGSGLFAAFPTIPLSDSIVFGT